MSHYVGGQVLSVKLPTSWKLAKLLDLSAVFHPQTDGQAKRVIQIPKDMLRGYVIEFRGCKEDYLLLAEFAYNNSYPSSIQFVAYEVLYGCRCRTPSCWTELDERCVLGPELISDTVGKVRLIWDRLKAASDRKKLYADLKHKEIEYSRVGLVAYQLELPSELDWIHDVFHVCILRRYRFAPAHIISIEEIEVRPDLTFKDEPIQILDCDMKVLRRRSVPLVKFFFEQSRRVGASLAYLDCVDIRFGD
ncbi:uncharacterized protein [Gossypium hirsutum]|uniref:Tf2-1-like SH3-like domain-containing protein n=1 Tax=Gossypium hirsutum TaxID=3635 RepID=A0ABM2YMX9_GOSHI|nr:uncharacterized protein LOC121205017 [Gossypium hirsutum]